MRTERWVPIAGAKQYRLYDGYVTNYHIGLCKNPDAMCDAINAGCVESGEYAISLNEVCGEHLNAMVWFRGSDKGMLDDMYLQVKIGNLRTTKEILNYAAGFKTGIEIEKHMRGEN